MCTQLEEEINLREEQAMQVLGYIVHRFCNGKIVFPVDDIAEIAPNLEVRRTYDAETGLITYETRLPE